MQGRAIVQKSIFINKPMRATDTASVPQRRLNGRLLMGSNAILQIRVRGCDGNLRRLSVWLLKPYSSMAQGPSLVGIYAPRTIPGSHFPPGDRTGTSVLQCD